MHALSADTLTEGSFQLLELLATSATQSCNLRAAFVMETDTGRIIASAGERTLVKHLAQRKAVRNALIDIPGNNLLAGSVESGLAIGVFPMTVLGPGSTVFIVCGTSNEQMHECMPLLRQLVGTIAQETRTLHGITTHPRGLDIAKPALAIADARLPDLPLIFVSEGFAELSGYGVDEAIGKNCRFLQKQDRDQPGLVVIRQALKDGVSCTVVLRNYTKQGVRFLNRVSLHPVLDDHGRTLAVIGLQRDVSHEAELGEDLEATRFILDQAPDAVFWTRRDGSFVYVNQTATDFLGYSRETLSGLTIFDISPGTTPVGWNTHWQNVIEHSQMTVSDWYRRIDGTRFPVEVIIKRLRYRGEELHAAFARDLTVRRQKEHELRLVTTAIATAEEGMAILSTDKEILDVNDAYIRITGYSLDELIGQKLHLLSYDQTTEKLYRDIWQSVEKEDYWEGEIRNRRKSGDAYLQWLRLRAVRDERGELINYVGVFSDITKIKRSSEELEELRNFDSLTKLANWVQLIEHMDRKIQADDQQSHEFDLLLLSLTGFRTINENLGYSAGDEVLKQYAVRLRELIDEPSLIARLHGDEFAIVFESESHRLNAAELANAISGLSAQALQLQDGHQVIVRAKIGISRYPQDGDSPELLLRNAEIAMNLAKSEGVIDFMFYKPALIKQSKQRIALETDFLLALQQREFEPYFQPLVRLSDRRVIGIEALARWNHASEGLLAPDAFIDLAEKTDAILALDFQILEQSLQHLASEAFADFGPLRLAVNFSVKHINDPLLPERLQALLEKYRIPPERLEIELTERSFLSPNSSRMNVLEAIRSEGIRLAIDDFGTGYSSLAYLQRLQADTIKLDRSFGLDVPEDPKKTQFTASILALSRNLDMEVVAEGVETEIQFNFLRQHRCNLCQGYLFTRPLPVTQFLDWIADQRIGHP